jgi:two-component system, chemotaxis family, chemotaxis protein CheY
VPGSSSGAVLWGQFLPIWRQQSDGELNLTISIIFICLSHLSSYQKCNRLRPIVVEMEVCCVMADTPIFPDMSVLIVDDGHYSRKLIREMLSRVNIRRVSEAPDGAEALGLLADVRPDVVILNWEMPILSGEEFIRLTRTPSTSPSPTVPIILMLSTPEKHTVERAVMLGVNEILVKPFSPKALWARLDEVVHRPRQYLKTPGGLLRPLPRNGNDKIAA